MVKTSLLVLLALPLVSARMRGASSEVEEKFPIARQLMGGMGGGGGSATDAPTDSVEELNYDSEDVAMIVMGSKKSKKMMGDGSFFKGDKESKKDSKGSKKDSKKDSKGSKKGSKKGGKGKKPFESDDNAHYKGSRK
jgi:hypothetical protein